MRLSKHLSRLKLGLGLTLAAAVIGGAASAGSSYDETLQVVLPKAALEFVNINPAIQMAAAYGDRGTGAHGSFGKFPAKFTTPLHTHSGAYHGVVLTGVMTNPFEGETNPPEMVAGSYWYVPAEALHATACVSETPCEFYFHALSAFDFHPVD